MRAVLGSGRLAALAGRRAMSSAAGRAGEKSSRLSKFHTIDIPTRMAHLQKAGFISPDTRAALEGRGLALEDANNMVENVLATFGMPMGVALNMTVNGKDHVVPMVLEEPSVVAGKWDEHVP